jgi:hypothetical protein
VVFVVRDRAEAVVVAVWSPSLRKFTVCLASVKPIPAVFLELE